MIAALFCLILAQAFAADSNVIQGVDATPLIEFLQGSVYTVTAPFKVFHYFKGWGEYSGQFSSNDPRGFRYVQHNAVQYLEKFGKMSPNASFFGSALYAATDPLMSMSYGKTVDWQMAEIEIPVGFRFFNHELNPLISAEASDVLVKLCGGAWKNSRTAAAIFQPYFYPQATSTCLEGMRQVLERVHIDAFTYVFGGVDFAACRSTTFRAGTNWAFVFMTDRWLKPELVHLFNRQSADNKVERLHLESVAYKASVDMYYGGDVAQRNYPSLISESTLPDFLKGAIPVHWDDLNGETTDADIDSWLKNNLFRCADNVKYEKAKD